MEPIHVIDIYRYHVQCNSSGDSLMHFVYNAQNLREATSELNVYKGRGGISDFLNDGKAKTETLELGHMENGTFIPKKLLYKRPYAQPITR